MLQQATRSLPTASAKAAPVANCAGARCRHNPTLKPGRCEVVGEIEFLADRAAGAISALTWAVLLGHRASRGTFSLRQLRFELHP